MDATRGWSYDFGAMMRPYLRPARWLGPLLGALAPVIIIMPLRLVA